MSGDRILFFTSHVNYYSHYETELELIRLHLEKGHEVVQLVCDAALPACDVNPTHDLRHCLFCIGRRRGGLGLVPGRVRSIPWPRLAQADRVEIAGLPVGFRTVKELQAFRIDAFPVGMAVASSLISLKRDPDLDLLSMRPLLTDFLGSAVAVYRSLQRHIEAEKPRLVYVFNGRYAHTRAAFAACESKGIDCVLHERGCSPAHYDLYTNRLPHDPAMREDRIRAAWAAAAPGEREAVAIRHFEDRAAGRDLEWYSQVGRQRPGLLPSDWNSSRRNVVLFTHSEDELESLADSWGDMVYPDQLSGIRRILESLADDAGIHVCVRVHPNLTAIDQTRKETLCALSQRNLTVIPPESPVSSYAVMRAADRVVSFGSTTGIEAAFWGRVSIVTGQTWWRNLGSAYTPRSHQELVDILKGDFAPLPREGALMFGYYNATFGIPFHFYKGATLESGTLENRNLMAVGSFAPPWNWLYRLSYGRGMSRFMSWVSRVHLGASRRHLGASPGQ